MKLLILLNVFTMTLLSFFTSWALVELILFLTHIRSHRFKAFARMIPVIKVPLDLLLMNWGNWAISHGLYPWLAEKNSRMLSVAFKIPHSILDFLIPEFTITFHMGENFNFSLADWIYGLVKGYWIACIVVGFFIVFTLSFFVKMKAFFKEKKELYLIIKQSEKLESTYFGKMAPFIQKYRVDILKTSSKASSPFTTGLFRKKIIIPEQTLYLLSSKEIEAVIAHEMAHISAKDLFVKFSLALLSIFFAFVPMKRLCRKICFDQEIAADKKALSYGIDKIDLATAIEKHAKIQCEPSFHFGKACFKESTRIRSLNSQQQGVLQIILLILSFYFLIGVFFGKFWFF